MSFDRVGLPFRCARRLLALGIGIFGTAGPALLSAQALPIPDSRDRVTAAVRATGPIQIDGRLDEADWAAAPVAGGFVQVEPFEGQPAAHPTEVRILFDAQNLYIGARMHDEPGRIARQLTRRDEEGRAADYFEFSIDPNLDRSTGYTFRVSAAGVQRDEFHFDDTDADEAWDGIWESEVTIVDGGWVAEIRIPLSQIRLQPSNAPQVWGLNFARLRVADNELSRWAFVPQGTHGVVSRWGRLEALEFPERRRYAEALPYVLAGAELAPSVPGDPFFSGSDLRGRVGADFRYGLGSTFVLDLALNPDFGQVQVDPRVINLSAFETFFPERRPFFTRDDALFDFSLPGRQNNLFYSRRIGRGPQGRASGAADFASVPEETSILGAGKVTGRTSGGLSVGGLLAVTEEVSGQEWFADEGRRSTVTVEPRTAYGTVRVQQDLREGQSRVGAMVNLVARRLPADGGLDFLPDRALTGGVDFEHAWSDRAWALSGFVAGSHVSGSEAAILRLQSSPLHNFQRPDQDYLPFDPAATSLSGRQWRLALDRRSGRNWTGGFWVAERGIGFDSNDLGFVTETEWVNFGARLNYRQPDPGEVLRSWGVNLFTFQDFRHSALDDPWSAASWRDAHKDATLRATSSFTLMNWWNVDLNLGFSPEVSSDVLTRGGPRMLRPSEREVELSLQTDERSAVTWGGSIGHERGGRGGWASEFGASVDARASDRLSISLGPAYRRSLDPVQYVTQVRDGGFEPTHGGRYFFGDLRREQLSMDTSIDFIASPRLSLQVFVQPLIAAGEFLGFKQLAAPGSFDFLAFREGTPESDEGPVRCVGGDYCRSEGRILLDYTGDGIPDLTMAEQDFNVRSLRGTAALRWEYRPGSRVYLVWQQQRQSRELVGGFDLTRDARGLFEAGGEHVFMIKVDYWLDL
jgi:hypothetical protein